MTSNLQDASMTLLSIIIFCPFHIVVGFLGIPDFLELGSCAQMELMNSFDPFKYQGIWFDFQLVPNEYQNAEHCIVENYTWSGSTMSVQMNGISKNGESVSKQAQMSPVEPLESSQEESTASMIVNSTGVPAAPYQVLWTDYNSISCVYSCLSFITFRAEFFWILSRTPKPSPKLIDNCTEIFESYKIDTEKLKEVTQGDGCDYDHQREDKSQIFKTGENQLMLPTKQSKLSNNHRFKSDLEIIIEDFEEIRKPSYIKDVENNNNGGSDRNGPLLIIITILVIFTIII